MKKYFVISLAAMALLACSKQEIESSDSLVQAGSTQVEAVWDGGFKTTLGGLTAGTRPLYWSEGDQLCINGSVSEALTGVSAEQTSATFRFDEVLSYPYKALYPASFYGASGKIVLPSTQSWAEGTFATGTAPAAAYLTKAGSMVMSNLCGVLKVKLLAKDGGDTDKITRVEFRGNANEKVSGELGIDYTMPVIIAATATDPVDKVVTVTMDNALSVSQPTEVYIVVPARTYASGFTLTIQDEKGHTMTSVNNASVTFEQGQILAKTTPLVFEPTATVIVIDTPSKLNAFATAFNSGEYDADIHVKQTANLVYDAETSEGFRSIGNDNYTFSGVYDGGGYTIDGLTTANSLFYVPTDATIKNVVYGENCRITHPSTQGGHWAVIARVLKGTTVIKDCVVNSDLTLYYSASLAGESGVGMIAGVMDENTSVQNCTVNGDINYVNDGQCMPYAQDIGGVVGLARSAGSSIIGCTMNGSLNFAAQEGQTATSSITTDLYIGVGGVIGKCNNTNLLVSGCTMNGDILWQDYLLSVGLGGICGWATCTMENCTVTRNMTVYVPCESTTEVKYVRAFYGGVAGRMQGTMTGCHNTASNTMSIDDSHNSCCVGGLIGKSFSPTVITDCSNSSPIMQNTVASNDMQVGGIVGSMFTGSIVSAVNTGAVTVKTPKPVSTSQIDVGGICGQISTPIDGGSISANVSAIHNSAQISADLQEEGIGYGFVNIGGVFGRVNAANANVSNVTNSGLVHVDVNKGDGTLAFKNMHEGGIIGRVAAAVTVSGCINTAVTRCWGGKGRNDSRTLFMGGIVGSFLANMSTGVAATLSDCHNYGVITNTNYNPQYPRTQLDQGNYVGGIIGLCRGASADNRAVVTGCTHILANGQRIGDSVYDSTYRGYIAGICGFGVNANLTNCTNRAYMKNSGSCAERVSGIVGITAACTVDSCVLDADIEGGVIAGVCSAANNATTIIQNCRVIATLSTTKAAACGALVHNTASGLQLLNNGIKGSGTGTAGTVAWTDESQINVYCSPVSQTNPTFSGNYIIED